MSDRFIYNAILHMLLRYSTESLYNIAMSICFIFALCMITPVIALDYKKTNFIKNQLKLKTQTSDTSVVIKNEWKTELDFNPREKRSDGTKCHVSCGSKHLPGCYCDDRCHYFNDCCLEAIKSDKQTAIKVLSIKQAFSCELSNSYGSPYPIKKPFGVVLVRHCLPKFQFSKIARKCSQTEKTTDLLHFMPVTSTNGMTYANIFCALCNGEEKVELWNLETYEHDLRQNVSKLNLTTLVKMLVDAYDLTPIPSSVLRPRICIRTTKSDQDTDRAALCSKYQEPVRYNHQVYRNHHCINKTRFQDCLGHHRCKVECIEEENIEIGRYIFDRNIRHNLIRISFAIQMEYDSGKCKSEEVLYHSKVKCIRLGCISSVDPLKDINCKMFEIQYSNYKVGLSWNFKHSVTKNENVLKRYTALLFYILYINEFVSLIPYVIIDSYTNAVCDLKLFKMPLAYRGILGMQELGKLNLWLDSLQISYLEKYATGNQSESLARVFGSKHKNSKTSFQKECTGRVSSSSLYLPNDKDLMITSLAKYQTPFLYKYKCSHIHLTLSITDTMDGSGKMLREYKPTEFHCVNGKSAITLNILSVLIVISFVLFIFRI